MLIIRLWVEGLAISLCVLEHGLDAFEGAGACGLVDFDTVALGRMSQNTLDVIEGVGFHVTAEVAASH